MNRKGILKSPWAISIGTAIFSLLLTMGYDYSKQNPILTTVGSIIKWIWRVIVSVLNIDLKVWWILLGIVAFVFVLYLIDRFKHHETFKPDFYNYREGRFKKWKWTWSWNWNQSRSAWIINDLQAHCPNCDTPMIEQSSIYGLSYNCPRCDFYANDNQCDEPHKIERIILDNVDRQRKEKNH